MVIPEEISIIVLHDVCVCIVGWEGEIETIAIHKLRLGDASADVETSSIFGVLECPGLVILAPDLLR
jgi:hypothetical protein